MSDTFDSFVTSLDGDRIDNPEPDAAAIGEHPLVRYRYRGPHKGNTKGNKLHPQLITKREATRLLIACGVGPRAVRSQAIIAVLYSGMLRSQELVCLRVADVNVETAEIRVLFGKGGKARTVAINERAISIVKEWLDVRDGLGLPPAGPLFCTMQGAAAGRKLPTKYLRELLAMVGKKAKIGKRVHPHGLRHSGACEMRKAGIDIGIISKALGHESIATTARYLDHISPVEVLDAMRKMEW